MAPEARVPAWKKIGLSIKSEAQVGKPPQLAVVSPHTFTGDVENLPQMVESVNGEHQKVTQLNETNTVLEYKKPFRPNTASTAKKSKIPKTEASADKDTEIYNLGAEHYVDQLTVKSADEINSSSARDSLTSRKRKSVNFTPDTKENDGDELQWITKEVPDVELSTPPKTKRQKRTKSSKSTSTQKSRSTPAVAPISDSRIQSILTYLEDFHKSKVLEDIDTTWKFNKAKEKGVVRYCLEVGENPIIPEIYDDAVHAYIKGLQSSFHRTYLCKMALQIRQNDEEDLEKQYGQESKLVESYQKALNRLKTESYKKAVDRHKKRLKFQIIDIEEDNMRQDPAWKFRLRRRQRAEMILDTIPETGTGTKTGELAQDGRDQQLDMSDNARTRVLQTTEVGGKKKRKRKRRTGVPDDDSSSSSSSDSDNDREDGNSAATQDRMIMAESSGKDSRSDDDSSVESSSEEDSSEEDSSEEENDDSDDNEVEEK